LRQLSLVMRRRNSASFSLIVRNRMLIRAVAAFAALPGIVAFALPMTIGISMGFPVQYMALAALPLCLGTVLLLWCVREFYVAGRGTLASWDPPQHLVTTRSYRFSRNPMYIAVVTILVGRCVLWGSRMLVIYTVSFLCGFHLRVLLFEEPWAARQFGAQWQEYRAHVPRWVI
jgi:protein-S-isoprenylcysteine O-methyltransferase Ste14